MEKKENYTYGVAYKLYAIENGEKTMLEEAPADQPFRFISGLSMALRTFEDNIVKLEENAAFEILTRTSSASKVSSILIISMKVLSSLCRMRTATALWDRYLPSLMIR